MSPLGLFFVAAHHIRRALSSQEPAFAGHKRPSECQYSYSKGHSAFRAVMRAFMRS